MRVTSDNRWQRTMRSEGLRVQLHKTPDTGDGGSFEVSTSAGPILGANTNRPGVFRVWAQVGGDITHIPVRV